MKFTRFLASAALVAFGVAPAWPATITISGLPVATSLSGSELVAVDQYVSTVGGIAQYTTRQTTTAAIAALGGAGAYLPLAGGTLTGALIAPSLTLSVTPLAVAYGGTGTSTPSLVAGANVTITGTWPNQTIIASGGGSGSPGGTSGQVQYNNAGAFGGFTVGGDATLNTSTGAITVTKSSGAAFGTAAFQNVGAFAQTTNNLSDLASASTARTNLGLGSLATQSTAALSVSNSDSSLTVSPTTGAVVASLNTANVNLFTGQQNFALQTLAGSGTIAWNLNTQQVAKTTLSASSTISSPTNMVAGGTYVLIIAQSGSGGFGITWGSAFKWPNATQPTLTGTAGGPVDIITFISDGTNMFGVWQGNFH